MKIYYITKYALTQGILEIEAEVSSEAPNMLVKKGIPSSHTLMTFYHKPYWHETLQEAQKHAELLRQKQIKILQKKIQKLEALKF